MEEVKKEIVKKQERDMKTIEDVLIPNGLDKRYFEKGSAFSVDEKTNRLIRALDGYITQINSKISSFFMIPLDARNFVTYMDRVIVAFMERAFPDSTKRIAEYQRVRDVFSKEAEGKSFYFQFLSVCQAMLITVMSMREELLVFGLDFKEKIGHEQKESIMQKIEETDKKTKEAGVKAGFFSFGIKTEKEEKKKLV